MCLNIKIASINCIIFVTTNRDNLILQNASEGDGTRLHKESRPF